MDPSEFEGTLEVEPDALRAGSLETLLRAPAFQPLDLSKEIDAIHLNVYNLTESLNTWKRINFGALLLAWDEQAVKISENKNDMGTARKALASKVKAFNLAHLSASSVDVPSPWQDDCQELIDMFKAHVDSLSSSTRFAETAFLSTYKLMTAAEDPSVVIGQSLEISIVAQEALKAAQENLDAVEQALEQKQQQQPVTGDVGLTFSLMAANREQQEKLEKQHIKEREEQESRHAAELADVRTRFEVEMRDREQLVRSDLERGQMELQQHFESLMERKDAQIASLLGTVSESSQRVMEAEEKGISLQHEVDKRRELEERLRAALTEAADSHTLTRELQTKFEDSFARVQALEAQVERDARKAAHDLEVANAERSTLRSTLQSAEQELLQRPPADVSYLAQALGIDLSEAAAAGNHRRMHWADLEPLMRESLRRSHSAAAEARAAEQDASSRLSSMVVELSRLSSALDAKEGEVAVLERDLVSAHRLLEGNQALLRSLPSHAERGERELDAAAAARTQTPLKNPPSGSASTSPAPVQPQYQSRSPSFSTSSAAQVALSLEKGAGGAGAAALLAGDGTDMGGSDRMMQAILSQRDRFMKQAREREAELAALKGRFDKLQEEQFSLRQDNLELYRRQRAMRAGAGISADVEQSTPSKDKTRARREVRSISIAGESDPVDAKYARLYESHIDPFRFEEEDRAAAISRLNVAERALAHLSRFLLQDRWTRHALLVYLLLVHLFALGYVSQILNPQLIDEVDYYNRAKFAQQTLDSFEIEPDW